MAMFDESNIMSEDEVASLFTTDDDNGGNQEPPKKDPEQQENNKTTEENLDLENLFDETPESVGSEQNNEGKKAPSSTEATSPTVLSSLAKALKEEGVLLDLEDSDIDEIKDAAGLKAAFEKQLKAQLDERQKRIDEALGNGVEPDVIRRYESYLSQLNTVTEDQIRGENPQSEKLREYLLRQEFLSRNYSPEQADKMVKRAIDSGTDVDDAIEALANLKTSTQSQYNKALDDARAREESYKKSRQQEADSLRKGIMEGKDFFGDLNLTQETKKKVLDNIVKPIWRDPDTGDTYTAIQKFEKENRVEFLQNVGIIFTLTEGFKNLEGLVKGKVTTAVKKGFSELEDKLNNTQRNSDGSLNFASGASDPNSFFSEFSLDLS